MGVFMMCRVRAQVALALAAAVPCSVAFSPAVLADLPQIKTNASNAVPECATPGRLTAFLRDRNGRLDDKFQSIAADYMRIGEELNVRWDAAFFQMLLETGNLTFTGDVSIKQNNFAGLGATGKRAPGETFADVPTGVRAHIEHLLLYAGDKLDNPVAERTRKVQEWGVLTSWRKTISGPMTFGALAKQWAPTSRAYGRDIEAVSDAFYQGPCKATDPYPEMMALARPGVDVKSGAVTQIVETASVETEPKITGAELARRAVEEARASGSFVKSSLGASSLVADIDKAKASATSPVVTILNAPPPAAAATESGASAEPTAAEKTASTPPPTGPGASSGTVQVAALSTGGSLKSAAAKPSASATKQPPKKSTCRVWTASYGGGRAVIIRANTDEFDNYTVLDVNEGAEKREAEAYIAAYAQGGATVAEFASPAQALDKAFEMCPEG